MQATGTLGGKRHSNSGAGVIVAITAAFLIGVGGGNAARSTASAAPATIYAGTVSALHEQAPDATDPSARPSLPRAGGPGGQLGDVPAGDDFCAAINRHRAC
jgi:hypothetical protein